MEKDRDQSAPLNSDESVNLTLLGKALQAYHRGDVQRSQNYCEQVGEADEEYPFALHLLSTMQLAQGHVEQALNLCSRAAHLNPDDATIQNGLAVALHENGQSKEALVALDSSVALDSTIAETYAIRSVVLAAMEESIDAMVAVNQALALDDQCFSALRSKGDLLAKLGRIEQAIEYYNRALAIQPQSAQLIGGKLDLVHYSSTHTAKDAFELTKVFWSTVSDKPSKRPARARLDHDGRPVHIGYISGDLRTHPVGFLFQPLFDNRNREQFHTTIYHNHGTEDVLTHHFKEHSDRWRGISDLGDEDVAAQIEGDDIDILVDLSGLTECHRLNVLRRKPAPIQATWLGYFATTGLEEIDYIIADRYVLPEGEEHLFVEKPVRLPDTYFWFEHPETVVLPSKRPAGGEGEVIFGSFNNIVKMSSEALRLWSEILKRVPNSRLLLKYPQLSQNHVRQSTLEKCQENGIAPDRVTLLGFTTRQEHLAAYGQVDIVLDTYPYGGATTTAEALWMGVPVITLSGDRWVSRIGESILMTAGLPQLVAQSKQQYVELAINLVRDTAERANMRSILRTVIKSSPICDTKRFAKSMESAYLQMLKWSQ